MKLTYWYAQCLEDSDVYSVRTKTKREAVARRRELNDDTFPGHDSYGPVIKVTVEYWNAFDLMEMCSQEDHHDWESQA